MIKSMTGYGKTEFEYNNKKATIEIKSLNSKQLDLSTRISSVYREKDLEIRKMIAERLNRGKVEFSLFTENLGTENTTIINANVVKSYYKQIKEIMFNEKLIDEQSFYNQVLTSILRMPDTLKTTNQLFDKEEWDGVVKNKIISALTALDNFRIQEGVSLENDIRLNIENIQNLLVEIEPLEKQRIETVKQRLINGLEELSQNGKIDNNRFEQELIFYIEKLDINEEKVRLSQHCNYFLETMNGEEDNIGKKLGFISQEIGREINTLGSKANEQNIQRIVVQMKDSLERIKEQVLNVL